MASRSSLRFSTLRAVSIPAMAGSYRLDPASATDRPVWLPTLRPMPPSFPPLRYRAAAVSGVAIQHFAPNPGRRAPRAALIGAGVQGRSHLAVLGHVIPGLELAIFDRHPERAEALAAAARDTSGIAAARAASSAREAVEGADVVVTAASFGPVRQVMTNDWLTPHVLVVPVDYATYCAAEVARDA